MDREGGWSLESTRDMVSFFFICGLMVSMYFIFIPVRERSDLRKITMQHLGWMGGEKQDARELDPACVITSLSTLAVSRGPCEYTTNKWSNK